VGGRGGRRGWERGKEREERGWRGEDDESKRCSNIIVVFVNSKNYVGDEVTQRWCDGVKVTGNRLVKSDSFSLSL
jgi:hypothetical protein